MPLIKIADELYYVQRAINNHQNADNSLAYMTYSDHTKASENKRQTGRNWAGTGHRAFTVPNTKPLTGYVLGDAVSRYSTSNKLVRVKDPRGFTVEMFIHDLVYLLENCTVINGVIQEPCRWGQNGKGHILIPQGSDMENTVEFLLKMKKTPNLKPETLRCGDKYVTTTGDMIVHAGLWRVTGEMENKFIDSRNNQKLVGSIITPFDVELEATNFYGTPYFRGAIGAKGQSKVIGIYEKVAYNVQDIHDALRDPSYWNIDIPAAQAAYDATKASLPSSTYLRWDKKITNVKKVFIH